jgi:outer membrane protein
LQNLIVRVVDAYLNILRANDNVEFVQAEKRAIERQLEQTKQRFEVGLIAITDVHEAQANFDTTIAQEIVARNTLELRKEQLREITGLYYDQVNTLNTTTFAAQAPAPETVEAWLDLAQMNNLDLQAQRFAVDIAKADIDSNKAGHLPTLGLSGSLSRSDFDRDGVDGDSDTSSLGITLSVPIYSGGATTSRTAQSRSRFVAESETLEQTYRGTVRNVRNSFNDISANMSTIKAFEQAVISAESALRATEEGFDVGIRTIVDVLNSTRNLFNARKNLANARYDFITAVISLKRAAGTLTVADIETLNKGLQASN